MDTSTLFSLAGRTALVTGGSRGIGRMIAEGFLAQGARVYISARKADACRQSAEELSAHGECIALPADVSTMDGVRSLVTDLTDREPTLDILVNNAGAAWGAGFEEFPEHGWDKVMNLNVKAPFFLSQALLPSLRAAHEKNGRLSKIINIASIDGLSLGHLETYSYHASKSGLMHLTRRMAVRLAPEGIAVSAIAPGAFASEMNREARDQADEVRRSIPAGRIGEPEDMAAAAIYLASRAGDYVMGGTVVVDGAVSLAR